MRTEPKCSWGEGRRRKGEGRGARAQAAGSHHHSTTEHLFTEGALPTQWTQTFPKPFAQSWHLSSNTGVCYLFMYLGE